MQKSTDVIGKAILDYANEQSKGSIHVISDICEDDELPVDYLFRDWTNMPELERKALELTRGKVLDVGAGTGCHASWLINGGYEVHCIDTSPGAVDFMKEEGLTTSCHDIMEYNSQEKYDTILLLMNGIGIAGTLSRLPSFLEKLKSLLNDGGQVLFESTDISYIYEQEDGSVLVNLNQRYMGDIKFQMQYDGVKGQWFDWLYLDIDTAKKYATEAGLVFEIEFQNENNAYLASLKKIDQ